MFSNMLGVVEAVAKLQSGATIGAIQKMNPHLSRGQVERVLKGLMGEGYVEFQIAPHAATGKKVWNVTNRCMTNLYYVAKSTTEGV